MHNLSIVAIVKDEPDLREWIEYHKLVGVDHFYLYDNCEGESQLDSFVTGDNVTVIEWPGWGQQLPAYNHFLKSDCARWTNWAAFIDADEYLVPVKTDYLSSFLPPAESLVGAIVVNWLIFGSSGHNSRPDGLVIENYQRCAYPVFDQNRMIKTIARPELIESFPNVHCVKLYDGYKAVDVWGNSVPWASTGVPNHELLQLNHYCTKSKEDFIAKLKRGRADFPDDPRDWSYFEYFDRNEFKNTAIQRFVPRVKEVMSR